MRENRPYGLEGGETGLNGLPYPYAGVFEPVSPCNVNLPKLQSHRQ